MNTKMVFLTVALLCMVQVRLKSESLKNQLAKII